MKKFTNIRRSGKSIKFSLEVSPEIEKFTRLAVGECNLEISNLTLNEIALLANFAVTELQRGAEKGARWFQNSIADGSILDNDYTRNFASPEGYIACEGAIAVLTDWLHSTGEYPSAPNWKPLREKFGPIKMENVMAAFAVYQIDLALSAQENANTLVAMSHLALAGDSLNSAGFNFGWNAGIQYEKDVKKQQAREGGLAKNKPMALLKTWVLERYRERTWPSPHRASHELAPKAIEKAGEFGTSLSAQRAQQTIYDWLRVEQRN